MMLTRLLEIIGEAASRVPKEEKVNFKGIAWKDVTGLRNRLIHAYDEVDFHVLWKIVKEDLPVLIAALEASIPPLPFSNQSRKS